MPVRLQVSFTSSVTTPMNMTDEERRAIVARLAEVQEKLRAVEAKINLTEWKELFREKLRLERQLSESDRPS